jgi:hypothetical protein
MPNESFAFSYDAKRGLERVLSLGSNTIDDESELGSCFSYERRDAAYVVSVK